MFRKVNKEVTNHLFDPVNLRLGDGGNIKLVPILLLHEIGGAALAVHPLGQGAVRFLACRSAIDDEGQVSVAAGPHRAELGPGNRAAGHELSLPAGAFPVVVPEPGGMRALDDAGGLCRDIHKLSAPASLPVMISSEGS